MPTSIAEPLHLSVLVVCGLIAAGIWSRAHVRYQQFLTLSLVSILIAETMKSTAVTDWMASMQMHLVWRGVTQTVCLLGLAFLTEAIRASVWGALWQSRRLYLRVTLVCCVGVLLVIISASVDPSFSRIENAGGILPALFLLLFSSATVVLCAQGLLHILINRRESSFGLWLSQAIIMLFSLDSLSLVVAFWLHGGADGRDDGGVLWFSCIAATGTVALAALGWKEDSPERDSEHKILQLWRMLYERRGQGDPVDVLEQRKWGGVDFTWIVVVRETADFLASESRKVSHTEQDSSSLALAIYDLDAGAQPMSEPRIIDGWDELVMIAHGLVDEN